MEGRWVRLGWLCWPSDVASAISYAVELANTVCIAPMLPHLRDLKLHFDYEVLRGMEFDHGSLLCSIADYLLCGIADNHRWSLQQKQDRIQVFSQKSQLLAWGWNLPAQSNSAVWYCFVKISEPLLKPYKMSKGVNG